MATAAGQSHVVQVRRPKAIVLDILGTCSKSGFLEKILFPYLKLNLENYININWSEPDFIKVYKQIVEQSKEFNNQEPATPIVLSHSSEGAKESLLTFINFVTENNVNSPAVTRLRFKIWFEGYQQKKLKTPIYSDVPNRLKRWYAEGIRFCVFSNTWVEAQVALLRNTNHGDLTNLISGHYDNDFGLLVDSDSWRRLCTELKEQPQDVLFLTKAPLEARAAAEAGLVVILVLTHRHNVRAITDEDRRKFAFVRTLDDLTWIEEQGRTTSQANLSDQKIATAISGTSTVGAGLASKPTTHTSSSTATVKPSGSSAKPTSGSAATVSSTKTNMGQSNAGGASSSQKPRPSSTSQR